MAQISPVLGLDFGTSNSAAAYLSGGHPVLVAMDGGQTTLPTTFFLISTPRNPLSARRPTKRCLTGSRGGSCGRSSGCLARPSCTKPARF